MEKRRTFLKQLGILTAGAISIPSELLSAERKVKDIGLQLYTFRKEMLNDPKGTLKVIADLGITQIESASSDKGLFYGLQPVEMKQICNDLGLKLRSGHCGIDAKWSRTVEQAAKSGQEYLICSTLPSTGQTVDNYKRVSDIFNKAAEECKNSGIKFGFHNHAYEFQSENGQVLYDVMLNNTNPETVHMEIDLGWVLAAGKDPFQYFQKYSGRFPLWHLKDMRGTHSTELGNGQLNIADLFKGAKHAGMKCFFIEQEEYPVSALDSIKSSLAYLNELKY